jgi:hypothetical protein
MANSDGTPRHVIFGGVIPTPEGQPKRVWVTRPRILSTGDKDAFEDEVCAIALVAGADVVVREEGREGGSTFGLDFAKIKMSRRALDSRIQGVTEEISVAERELQRLQEIRKELYGE